MTAAWKLSREPDFSVTLVESSDHLGGLAAGFPLLRHIAGKNLSPPFSHRHGILDLVGELGLEDKLIWCESSVGIYRDGKIHPFKTPLDLLRFRRAVFRDGCGRVSPRFISSTRKTGAASPARRAHDWMTRVCGRSAMETIWTPLLEGKFDRHFDNVSMAWLWARIHIRANSRAGRRREKLGYFRGGFNVITSALENEIRKRGVEIRTGATVEKLSTGERAAVVNGETVPFDFCIFTGPSPAFARLLPGGRGLE